MRALLFLLLLSSTPVLADYMDHFASREDVGPRKAPYLGDAKLLLLLVEVEGFAPFDEAHLRQVFSAEREGGFVKFYETASLGRYRPRVTVAPKVHYARCPLPVDQFPGCALPRGDATAFNAGMNLMRDVVRRVDEAGFDFSAHDVNGRRGVPDGWLDGVMILTNTPFGGIAFPFGYFNHGDNLDGGVGGPLVVDGKQLGHLAIAGDSDAWVLVHEFGHLLGLTDLYDETQRTDGLWLSFMGAWSYDPKVPLPDAETRLRLRWANWHQVQGEQRVTVRPAESSGDVYRLGIGSEYYLVENRGPGGAFDQAVTTRGLAIFHVDRTKVRGEYGSFIDRLLTCVNCDAAHPFIGLEQADGRHDLEHGKPFVPSEDLYVTGARFEGALRDGGAALSVRDVVVRSDGVIEATLGAPAAGQCDETLCAEGQACAPLTCGDAAATNAPGCGCSAGGPAPVFLALALWLRRRCGARSERVAAANHWP